MSDSKRLIQLDPGQNPVTPPSSHLLRFSSEPFRLLFLLLAVHALGMITLWSLWWNGSLPFALPRNPIYWHGHEMISGFAGAAIGGFLLTAVANWTGRPTIGGWRLWLLCLCWIGGRASFAFPLLQALFDAAYWFLLLLLVANEILRAGNRRNYRIIALLALLAASDLAWHASELWHPALLRQWLWAQLWLVVLLVSVIGGRIIPAFTGNWLRRRALEQKQELSTEALPPAFNRFDLIALLALVSFALCTLIPAPGGITLVAGLAAAVLHALRLCRWQGHRTLADPLVWMLHLSYAWMPIGLALLAFAGAGYLSPSAGIHALTMGTIAGMIVSVSARAALGHTNRPLRAHPLLTAAIVLLNLATVVRICATLFAWPTLVPLSAVGWLLAFLCYTLVHLPILLGPPLPLPGKQAI